MDTVLRPARLLAEALLVATTMVLLVVVGAASATVSDDTSPDHRGSSSSVSIAAGASDGSGHGSGEERHDGLASGPSIAPVVPVVGDLRATNLPRDPWFSGRTGFIDTRHSSQHHTRPGTSPG